MNTGERFSTLKAAKAAALREANAMSWPNRVALAQPSNFETPGYYVVYPDGNLPMGVETTEPTTFTHLATIDPSPENGPDPRLLDEADPTSTMTPEIDAWVRWSSNIKLHLQSRIEEAEDGAAKAAKDINNWNAGIRTGIGTLTSLRRRHAKWVGRLEALQQFQRYIATDGPSKDRS